MTRHLVHASYGWLLITGLLHFCIDVVSHVLRHKHPPGPEATLYYGLNSAFALGQVALGAVGLLLALQAVPVVSQRPMKIIALAAGLGWFAIAWHFMDYTEPKVNAGIFCVLAAAALL
jgi:hypothetical protein